MKKTTLLHYIFTIVSLSISVLYADVIVGDGNIERLSAPVTKDINCQNYTIKAGGLLDTSAGGILREVTRLEINGEWDFGTGMIKELGAWVNNGTVDTKPTQGAGLNLEFTTLCGPISILGTADTDGDGISDADEGDTAVALGHGITLDQDGDGVYNFLDDDSDGDGLSDAVEGGNAIDTDGDGIPDYLDADDSRPMNSDDGSTTGNTIGDDAMIDILANDTLEDGTTPAANDVNVTLIVPTGGTLNPDGSVTVIGEGRWSYDATTGMLTFSPISGFTGNPTPIEYTVTDIATGLTSTPATVNVAYVAATMNPVADDDNSTGNIIGDDVSIDILDGDTLGDGSIARPSDVNIILQLPTNGVLNADGSVTVTGEGTWKYEPTTGMLTFSPISGYVGNLTPVEYTIKEISTGLISAPATVTVAYKVMIKAEDDEAVTIRHYGPNTIDVLNNDMYNGSVTIEIVVSPEIGTVEIGTDGNGRAVIVYTAEADVNNVSDTFRYSVTDENNRTSEAVVHLDIKCASSQTSDGGDTLSDGMILLLMLLLMMMGFSQYEKRTKGGEEW